MNLQQGGAVHAHPPTIAAPEYAMSGQDFDRVCEMIRRHAGIALNPSKKSMVYSRLARRLRATGMRSFTEYLDALEGGGPRADEEWQGFVNALTTNLTSFFREAHHFPILAEHLQRLRARERINIWCCAASTGEEPYSIAMTAQEAFAGAARSVRILATDIDTAVLATARSASYRDEQVARVDGDRVRRFFLRGSGANEGWVRVRPEVCGMVTFRQLNLLDTAWPLRPGFDAIFCRNVMIYFDKPTQYGLLRRFAPLLNPGGLLFVGHSENFAQARDVFQLLGKTVYEVNPGAACRLTSRPGNA
ncbi:MAG: chemotaxis protein CheR [Burkholderiales bacterium]|nr:chemotaxis protein CheR [Burkholderiales bacterium]